MGHGTSVKRIGGGGLTGAGGQQGRQRYAVSLWVPDEPAFLPDLHCVLFWFGDVLLCHGGTQWHCVRSSEDPGFRIRPGVRPWLGPFIGNCSEPHSFHLDSGTVKVPLGLWVKGLICVKLTTPYLSPETPIQWLPWLLLAGTVSEPREALDVLEARGKKWESEAWLRTHSSGQSRALSPVQDVPVAALQGAEASTVILRGWGWGYSTTPCGCYKHHSISGFVLVFIFPSVLLSCV